MEGNGSVVEKGIIVVPEKSPKHTTAAGAAG